MEPVAGSQFNEAPKRGPGRPRREGVISAHKQQ